MVFPVSPLGGAATAGLGIFIPQSAQSLVPFADNAARDAWANANPADLLENQTVIFVTGTPDVWYIWRGSTNPSTPISASDWQTYTGVVRGGAGPEGPAGPAGTDGDRLMFVSIAARDTFYATQPNRDGLSNGDVISVNVGNNTVEFQEWTGVSAPTSYDANNFITSSIRTSNASINFADELRIFDYGEIPAFEDRINNITALAIGQRFSDAGGSQTARQLNFPAVTPLLVVPEGADSALQQVHTYTFDTTGIISNPAIVVSATINFLVAPNFYIVEIFQGTDDTGTRVFRGRFDPGGTAGQFTANPDSPQRFLPDTTYFFRLTGDIPFQYRTPTGLPSPAGTSNGFEFTFEDLATQIFTQNNIAGLGEGVSITTDTPISSGNVATYNRKFIIVPSTVTGDVPITIAESSNLDGFVFYNFGGGNLTVSGLGAVTIDGQSSVSFGSRSGGRIAASPTNGDEYVTVYSNASAPSPVAPSATVTDFTINIPSTVNLNTDLNNQRQVQFRVANVSNVTAIDLIVSDGDNKSLTLPSSDGLSTQNVTLSGIDTSSAKTLTFRIRLTLNDSTTVFSNMVSISVRNILAREQAYWGVSSTNNPGTILLSNLTGVDVSPPGTTYDINTNLPNGQFLIILEPSDRPITDITELTFNVSALSQFTNTDNVRNEGGLAFNAYVLENNGPSGNVSFRVTHQ